MEKLRSLAKTRMAPSGRGGRRRRRKNQNKQCRPRWKKAKISAEDSKLGLQKPGKQGGEADADSSDGGHDGLPSGCCTPKDRRYRIPECVACPPAPKKCRTSTGHCSQRRPPVSFFIPPDLELFFLFAVPADV